MDCLKNSYLDDLSHDLILNGSEEFYSKIKPEDYDTQFLVDYPYPVQAPIKELCKDKVKLSSKVNHNDKQRKQAQREFNQMKDEICDQKFQKYAILPKFFIDYMENNTGSHVNYGCNLDYSFGVLEKFYLQNSFSLIRPDSNNNLVIFISDRPEEKIILQWPSPDQILSIKNMNIKNWNGFVVRGENTIHLMEIDEDLRIKLNMKLNCDAGYQDTSFNNVNKSELAIIDTRNKLKLFNVDCQKVSSVYTKKELNLHTTPRLVKIDYLTQNMLLIMTDKHIKVLDNRCREVPQDIQIKLENCDILMNFTFPKNNEYLAENVYMASKHSYFIYDVRMTAVNDFMHHNLRSTPCFVNYFEHVDTKLVTLFSQSPTERALFGKTSPYSLPYHIINLEDTFDRCRSTEDTPFIPEIDRRLSYSVTGVQLVDNNDDVSIYTTNVLGELFRQDILLGSRQSDTPIRKMHAWLLEIDEIYDPELNVVHLANAEAAFNLDVELNEIDLYEEYEKCNNVHAFLEEDLEIKEGDAETFLQIWNDVETDDLGITLEEPSISKVEKWMENAEFNEMG